MLNDFGILEALGKSESTVVLVYDEVVIECGESYKFLAAVGRGGDAYGFGLVRLCIAENHVLFKRNCTLCVLLRTYEEVNLLQSEILCHILSESGELRCAGNLSGKNGNELTALLKVTSRERCKQERGVYLELGNTANRKCLRRAFLDKVLRGICDNDIELILGYLIKEGYGVVIF